MVNRSDIQAGRQFLSAIIAEALGDEVVTVCRQHARARNSGVIVEMRFATVSTVSAGLQTRTEFYADPHEALQAVGLE